MEAPVSSESLTCIEQTSRRHISLVLTTVRKKNCISVFIATHFFDLLANLVHYSVSAGVQCEATVFPSDVRTEHDVTFSATKLIVQSAIYRTGTLNLNICLSVMDKFDPDSSRMRGQNLCEQEASHFPHPSFPIPQYD
jgi:hypothetical protein